MAETLLDVRGLRVSFGTEEGTVRALFGVSFSVAPGETVGLVGESGCGKTVTALAVLRLLQSPPAIVESGEIVFRGEDLLALPEKRMCAVRGKAISMIFQEPMSSLNPVFTVGFQLAEVLTGHAGLTVTGRRARVRAVELLREVGIPEPEAKMDAYPFQLSGGQQQRVMIAMAIACEPRLLIADEPTTALDVTIQ
ncbi:MAG: oppD, partial [Deltaproteobacteria bacterium]|nr:oppD [Deltaproteobacteria bacterium]MBS1244476.1 oppD [Deltaproteobacteria bacterium]